MLATATAAALGGAGSVAAAAGTLAITESIHTELDKYDEGVFTKAGKKYGPSLIQLAWVGFSVAVWSTYVGVGAHTGTFARGSFTPFLIVFGFPIASFLLYIVFKAWRGWRLPRFEEERTTEDDEFEYEDTADQSTIGGRLWSGVFGRSKTMYEEPAQFENERDAIEYAAQDYVNVMGDEDGDVMHDAQDMEPDVEDMQRIERAAADFGEETAFRDALTGMESSSGEDYATPDNTEDEDEERK